LTRARELKIITYSSLKCLCKCFGDFWFLLGSKISLIIVNFTPW